LKVHHITIFQKTGDNKWDNGYEGNYWDDFADNPGYPNVYEIPGGNNIDLYPLIPPLIITPIPSTVPEGESFIVEVTAIGIPVEDVQVDFMEVGGDTFSTQFTGENGTVIITTPMVEQDTLCAVIASKGGYWFTTAFTTVLNDDSND